MGFLLSVLLHMNLTTCTIFKVPQVNLQISDD